MAEQLLTPTDVMRKLRISRAKFYRIRAKLLAQGMRTVVIGGSVKYVESSIDKMILRAVEKEVPLC